MGSPPRRCLGAVLCAVSLVALAAGSARATVAGTGSLPSLSKRCHAAAPGASLVRFRTADGVRLDGATIGRGRVGLVLANQAAVDLCDWLEGAEFLASRGFRVLLFDYRGTGLSQKASGAAAGRIDLDVVAAAAELRRLGSQTIVVVGSSIGGIGAIYVAPTLEPAPAAIVTLSASGGGEGGTNSGPDYGNLDADVAVRQLSLPLLLVAADNDPHALQDAEILYRDALTSDKRLFVASRPPVAYAHGTGLLDRRNPASATVRHLLVTFIRART